MFAAFAEQIPELDKWLAQNIDPDGGGYNPYLLSLEEREDLTAKVNCGFEPWLCAIVKPSFTCPLAPVADLQPHGCRSLS